jgi:hypothetical protein
MEKLQSLLWILLALGVFVVRMVQKMRATSAQEARERPNLDAPALPAATFQEMLKQMQARNAGETVAPEVGRTPAGRQLPHEVARPAKSQERTRSRQTSLEVPAATRPLSPPTPVARRASSLPRANSGQSDQTYWNQAAAVATEPASQVVRRLLASPADLRAAFVLTEILQRRY